MLILLAPVGAILLLAACLQNAAAQRPQFAPATPLYYAGPLTAGAPSGRETTTPFQWASFGAGAANPAPGQCVRADRAARGSEISPGGGNVIRDFSGAMKSAPTGPFVEVGVARDPLVSNCMPMTRSLALASPPFTAVPALPPFMRPGVASARRAAIVFVSASNWRRPRKRGPSNGGDL